MIHVSISHALTVPVGFFSFGRDASTVIYLFVSELLAFQSMNIHRWGMSVKGTFYTASFTWYYRNDVKSQQ